MTDPKKAALALNETEERLKLALRVSGLGIFDWLPMKGELIWDDKAGEILGQPADLEISKYQFFFDTIHPDDKEVVQGHFTLLVDTEDETPTFHAKFRILKDGETHHIKTHGTIFRNTNGLIHRVIGTVQDVTIQKRNTERINFQAKILGSISEAIISTDEVFTIKSWNKGAEELYGWKAEEAIGKPMEDIVPVDYLDNKRENVIAEFMKEGKWRGQVIQLDRNKQALYIQSSISAIYDKNGNFTGAIGINQNITKRYKAELALRNSEERYRSLVENTHDAIFCYEFDPPIPIDLPVEEQVIRIYDGKLVECNIIAAQMHGFDYPYQVIGKKTTELFHIKPGSPSDSLFETFVKNGYQNTNQVGVEVLPNGKKRYFSNNSHGVIQDGKLLRSWGTYRNITEQKEAESILRKNEERFRTIFNQQFQFMTILTPEGKVSEINDLPVKVQGAPKSAYIGKYFWDVPAWDHLPEERAKIKRQVLASSTQQNPLLVVDKFGTTTGEIRYSLAAYSAIRDDEGKVKYLLVQATDITERKLAEEELKKTQRALSKVNYRFKISTQAARIGIWDWNIRNDQLHWDHLTHELYGIRKEQFQGTISEWFGSIHPEDREKIIHEIEMAVAGEMEFNTEFRIIWPDQSIRHIKATASVQTDPHGQAEEMIGTQWDITQEKEAEKQKVKTKQLEAQNKELERFAYVASHDLQEPLRTVKSFVKLLESNPHSTLSQKERVNLSYISQAANRMSRQIRDLLDYSRIGRNKKPKMVDCEALIKQAINDLSAQIKDTQAVIEKQELPMIMGYEMEIRILFQNLISNGLKFHKKGVAPKIQITVEENKDHWKFCVKDNGIGIEPAFTEKVFLIFQRLNPREEYEGSGIGLSHCYRIVDLHRGRIWAESVPGEGSSFFFTIPRID